MNIYNKLVLLFITAISFETFAQKIFVPEQIAYTYFESYIRLLQGKYVAKNNDIEILRCNSNSIYNVDIFEFNYINMLDVRKHLFVKILKDNNLERDTILIEHLLHLDSSEISFLDSVIFKYLKIAGIDSLIDRYIDIRSPKVIYTNAPLDGYYTCIMAYGKKYGRFYKLLGYETNDFEDFFKDELYADIFYRKDGKVSSEKQIRQRLRELSTNQIDLEGYYDYYVKKKNFKERYPIKFSSPIHGH